MAYMLRALGTEPGDKIPSNVIVSALGSLSTFIDVNGCKLEDGDKIFLSSDGISDLMLDAEIASILDHYPDLDDAGHSMLRLAESRKQKGRHSSSIPPDPSNDSASEQIKGHNDDKTVVLDKYSVDDKEITSVLDSNTAEDSQ
jgi:serine/threonine protein phosphatase PrpC